jgi:hypothetical protein
VLIVFAAGEVARTPSFFVSLLCPSPFFEALDEVRVELAAWIDKFSFPLEIPASGMELGQREPSQIIIVNNAGDVSCGCTISFTALGTLTNPEIMNVDTGEVFRLLKTIPQKLRAILESLHEAKEQDKMAAVKSDGTPIDAAVVKTVKVAVRETMMETASELGVFPPLRRRVIGTDIETPAPVVDAEPNADLTGGDDQ